MSWLGGIWFAHLNEYAVDDELVEVVVLVDGAGFEAGVVLDTVGDAGIAVGALGCCAVVVC
jgi:hypothetical protein